MAAPSCLRMALAGLRQSSRLSLPLLQGPLSAPSIPGACISRQLPALSSIGASILGRPDMMTIAKPLSTTSGILGTVNEITGPDGHVEGLFLSNPDYSEPLADLSIVNENKIIHDLRVNTEDFAIADVAKPLVDHALDLLRGTGGSSQPPAVNVLVPLRGLCPWVAVGERWEDGKEQGVYDEDAAGAAEAMALGRPRPGHSVLGIGTFRAAEPAWMHLAEAYLDAAAELPPGASTKGKGLSEVMAALREEVVLYESLGAKRMGVIHLVDKTEEALKDRGGAMLHLMITSGSS